MLPVSLEWELMQYTHALPVAVSPGVLCVEVSVEEELLVVGSDDGVVSVWSLADQQLIHLLLGHTGSCWQTV